MCLVTEKANLAFVPEDIVFRTLVLTATPLLNIMLEMRLIKGKITVLMPLADQDRLLLEKSMESVIGQTCRDWFLEIITSKYTSRKTLKLLDGYKSSRIDIIETDKDRIPSQLNLGMRSSRTKFVCLLHSDDVLDKNAISTLLKYTQKHKKVDYFHSSRILVDDKDNILRCSQSRTLTGLSDFKKRSPVKALHCWNVRKILSLGGMDQSLRLSIGEDYDFTWDMAEKGARFMAIPESLYFYRVHQKFTRLTTHVPYNKQVKDLRKIFLKHGLSEKETERLIRRAKKGLMSHLNEALFRSKKGLLKKHEKKENIEWVLRT